MNILFVTWDGPQVTYLEGLFGPILQGLRREGYRIHVVQFTWAGAERTRSIEARCNALGLSYEARRILRVPRSLGALLTACWGALHLRKVIRERAIGAVLARSILPSLASLLALRGRGVPLVFDADGLLLDEMVDFAGLAPTGFAYRFLRDVEALAVRRAVSVMTRSESACKTLLARAGAGTSPAKFFVVQNGRDPARYRIAGQAEREQVRAALGIPASAPLVVYAGSLGPKYCLVPMLRLFQAIRTRRPDAEFLLLTTAPEHFHAVTESGLKEAVRLLSVEPGEVPALLAASDVGLALIEPAYSMHAASAVKTAEYLLCGVPVFANHGIGDIEAVIDRDTGFLVRDVHAAQPPRTAVDWFLEEVLPARDQFRIRCRQIGEQEFSLERAVASYARALAPLRKGHVPEHAGGSEIAPGKAHT